MDQGFEVDGSFFVFPDGWELQKLDEWIEQKRITSSPFYSKSCDLAAIKEGVLWLIEAKDYTYAGAKVPADLIETVALKLFHTLAILHMVARWGEGSHQGFSKRALQCKEANFCLAIELPDVGRKLIKLQKPLSDLQAELRRVTRKLNASRVVVSNSFLPNGVPWEVKRDPASRNKHRDR